MLVPLRSCKKELLGLGIIAIQFSIVYNFLNDNGYLVLNSCHEFSDVTRLIEQPTAPEPVPSRVLTCPENVALSVLEIGASIV